jgi:hypothetical protein
MGCINKNLKDNQRLIQDFSETRVNQLFDEYFPNENPSYSEFISNPNVKEALGIIPISKVKSEIGKAFGKEISSRELRILKKSISDINDKLLGYSYKLFNIKQKGESDNYSWGIRKINSNINIQAKIDRLKQRINTNKQIRNLEDNQFNYPDINQTIKPGVEELFNENKELSAIGTKEQYSIYLNSKGYKNIYYHYSTSDEKFDKFSKDKIGTANLQDTSGVDTVSLVDNFKLAQAFGQFGLSVYPMSAEDVISFSEEYANAHNKNIVFVGINNNIVNEGKVFKTSLANGFEINVENINALDILGSKQDIEGFKKFVSTQQLYSQYLESLNKPNTNPILQGNQTNVEEIITQLEKDGLLEIDCKGKLKAKDGLRDNFTKGGKWKVIKDLKGYPTHKKGGVDLTIGKDGVKIKNSNTEFTAKHGLVIPKN